MATKTASQIKNLSPVPHASRVILDKAPYLTEDWLNWFTNLFRYVTTVFRYYDSSRGGTAILVGGTVFVASKFVTVNSLIRMTAQNVSGTSGTLSIVLLPQTVPPAAKITSGFTITSSNALDTRTIFYEIMEAY